MGKLQVLNSQCFFSSWHATLTVSTQWSARVSEMRSNDHLHDEILLVSGGVRLDSRTLAAAAERVLLEDNRC